MNHDCRFCGYRFESAAAVEDHEAYSLEHLTLEGEPLCFPQPGDDE